MKFLASKNKYLILPLPLLLLTADKPVLLHHYGKGEKKFIKEKSYNEVVAHFTLPTCDMLVVNLHFAF